MRWKKSRRETDDVLPFVVRDLVNASLRNMGKAPGGEYRTPPLVRYLVSSPLSGFI